MKVRYDEAQDITLFLTEQEERILLSGPTKHFMDLMHKEQGELDEKGMPTIVLRGFSKELKSIFYLGYSQEKIGQYIDCKFIESSELDAMMGSIVIPEIEGDPWSINLSVSGIEHYKRGWPHGVRYDGEHKLFIIRGLTNGKNNFMRQI